MNSTLSSRRRSPLEVLSLYPSPPPTFCGLLESRASADALRPFLLYEGRTWSYADFQAGVLNAAQTLVGRGMRKGDRIAVIATNSDSYLLLLFAVARIGAILVPVNPELNAAEARYILEHAAVNAVACVSSAIAMVRAACESLAPQPWVVLLEGESECLPTFAEWARSSTVCELPEDASPDDTCLILYTSGTTGYPKGVMHSQRNFVLAGEGFVERMHLQPEDRLFVVLPLFHINALFYSLGGALAAGASLLLAPRFSASGFWSTAAHGGATELNIIAAVGNILTRRARDEFVPGHQLRKIYGAGMSPETLEVFPREFGVPVLIEGYGLTEVPGVSNNPFPGPHRAGSIGRPSRHPDGSRLFSEMRVIGEDGNQLPPGEIGELAVRSPIVMQGYYRDAEATAKAFRDGWFLTGDLGYRDADDYYYFVARKKDIIRRRGENISGAEIDRVVAAHPQILEAAAIAVPSELGEDEILLAVVSRTTEPLSPAEIVDWCARHLSPMKQPTYFLQVDSLPHTPTHRVAKFKLKEDTTLLDRAVDLRSMR
jgi:crotonobetaine/carnitine-CoA ligase